MGVLEPIPIGVRGTWLRFGGSEFTHGISTPWASAPLTPWFEGQLWFVESAATPGKAASVCRTPAPSPRRSRPGCPFPTDRPPVAVSPGAVWAPPGCLNCLFLTLEKPAPHELLTPKPSHLHLPRATSLVDPTGSPQRHVPPKLPLEVALRSELSCACSLVPSPCDLLSLSTVRATR